MWKLLFVLFSALIAAADIKAGKVPRIAFAFAFPFFFVIKVLMDEKNPVWEPLMGCLAGFSIFLLVFFISGKKLGLADVWYSALIGLVLGPLWWYAAMCCACVTGIIYLLISKQRKFPFIPFMALGSFVMCVII